MANLRFIQFRVPLATPKRTRVPTAMLLAKLTNIREYIDTLALARASDL